MSMVSVTSKPKGFHKQQTGHEGPTARMKHPLGFRSPGNILLPPTRLQKP